MINNLINNLPDDINNIIFKMVGPHPISKILKQYNDYEEYIFDQEEGEDKKSFKSYVKYYDIMFICDKLRIYQRQNDRIFRCSDCGYYFKKNDIYFGDKTFYNYSTEDFKEKRYHSCCIECTTDGVYEKEEFMVLYGFQYLNLFKSKKFNKRTIEKYKKIYK